MRFHIGSKSNFQVIIYIMIATTANSNKMPEGVKTVHDLCFEMNSHMYTLDENESYQLILKSETPSGKNQISGHSVRKKCILELKTCPSCHLVVIVKNMTIPSCSNNECSCNYFEITEPLSGNHGTKYCGYENSSTIYFESKTKIISFSFVQNLHIFYVTLQFTAYRNIYVKTGIPNGDSLVHERFIESPHFPKGYPSDYSAEYILQSIDPMGYVQLLFIDFQLSRGSFIEVSSSNSSHIKMYNGVVFRPPVIISEGNTLNLKFQANYQISSPGFRATYTFSKISRDYQLEKPYTECGGYKDGYGGIISAKIPEGNEQLCDCLWLIQPPIFPHQTPLLSALLIDFRNIASTIASRSLARYVSFITLIFSSTSVHHSDRDRILLTFCICAQMNYLILTLRGAGSILEFRQGLTSEANLLKVYHSYDQRKLLTFQPEVIIPSSTGLYIRLRGYLTNESSVLVAYSAYSIKNCTTDEFPCNNKRCIKKFLHCDGFSQCSDGSDEEHCIFDITDAVTTSQAIQSTLKDVNHNKDNVIAFGARSLIIITGVAGLIIFLITVTLLVTKWYKMRERAIPISRQPLQTISGMINIDASNATSHDYDPPPSYDDVMKFSDFYPLVTFTVNQHAKASSITQGVFATSYESLSSDHKYALAGSSTNLLSESQLQNYNVSNNTVFSITASNDFSWCADVTNDSIKHCPKPRRSFTCSRLELEQLIHKHGTSAQSRMCRGNIRRHVSLRAKIDHTCQCQGACSCRPHLSLKSSYSLQKIPCKKSELFGAFVSAAALSNEELKEVEMEVTSSISAESNSDETKIKVTNSAKESDLKQIFSPMYTCSFVANIPETSDFETFTQFTNRSKRSASNELNPCLVHGHLSTLEKSKTL